MAESIKKITVAYLVLVITILPLVPPSTFFYSIWEGPKVLFMQFFLPISFLLLILNIITLKLHKTFKVNKNKLAIYFVSLLILLWVTVVHTNIYTIPAELYSTNLLYNFFIDTNLNLSVHIFGNPYRQMGLITLFSIFCSALLVVFVTKYQKYLFLSLLCGSAFQILLGLYQYVFGESGGVFGSYGQTNFFTTHILILLPFVHIYFKKNLKAVIFAYSVLVLVTLLAQSYFALFIILSSFLFYFAQIHSFVSKKTIFAYSIFSILSLSVWVTLFEEYRFRLQIWSSICRLHIDAFLNGDFFNFFFGFGLDSMNFFLYKLVGTNVDRAHNIFLDILFSFGIFGFTLTCLFLFKLVQKITQNNELLQTTSFRILLYLFAILMIKLTVHTYSVANIFFVASILFLILGNLYKNKP